ncbi:sigma 54-interacting transcriptional regulator [Desulfovibrio aminophilus]|uniref:sigma 54-interacting transcriptional regulator n=1 Tax=Desulfovibrio aminophilus TaxID=81425 RepID=UPI003392EFDB
MAINHVVGKALELDMALGQVLTILSENLSMKRATVTLVDRITGQLVIAASHGLTPEERARGVYRLDEGVTGRIFQTGKPYIVPDIRKEPLFLDRTGSRGIERDKVAFLGVPVMLHGEPLGVLNVDRLFGDAVNLDEDVEFLAVVATLVAHLVSLRDEFEQRLEHLERENVSLKYRLSRESSGPYIIGQSPVMQDVERLMERVAPTRATVLLLGESGTGKTLIARIIHDLSGRKNQPFVKVNCAAIPENLLEAELFGHEKGAFSGAVGIRAGRFEEANRGSIFLDEVGELPLGIQAKLLRVIQEREFERLGSNQTRTVDVRILTATNRHLEELVEQGRFREDLYYRLNVFPIRVPSLRERKEDLELLINHFLRKVAKEYGRKLNFTAEALGALKTYDWPGNVRELENMVERLAIMAVDETVDLKLLLSQLEISPDGGVAGPDAGAATPKGRSGRRPSLREMEKQEVLGALREGEWVIARAARILGITPRQMGYRVMRHGLSRMVAMERAQLQGAKRGE